LSRPDEGLKRPIVISMGEPSGIGPEIAVKAWVASGGIVSGRRLQLLGDPAIYAEAARLSGIAPGDIAPSVRATGSAMGAKPGRPSPAHAGAVTGAIREGVRACLAGEAAALVTAPIHKSVLTQAGFGFPGHTEFLAALTGRARAVMMLASHALTPPLRVVPFTVHLALKEIFSHLDADAIVETGTVILDALMRDFGCARPRLALAGLNPHAGEDATMGLEDRDILAPAAARLRADFAASGAEILGPLPADSLFHDEARARYDAALCLYHDQALIPIKTLAFWSGVNVTLGLPIVRTSPDHGTALHIAGSGRADARSMIAAIAMAADIAERRGL
jgi:4-hydroxythreonine-4-phosphate dehydrogenase